MTKCAPWFLPLVAVMLSGCEIGDAVFNSEHIRGSGRVVQEKRDVHGFNQVRLSGVGSLEIRQGNQESLTVEADDNILPRIRTDVEDGTLVIGMEPRVSVSPTAEIRYQLTVRELSALGVSGSGDIHSASLRGQSFGVHVSGSGKIMLEELTATTLTADISGSGTVEMSGKVDSQNIHISGSGDYDCGRLQSDSTEVTVSGSGDSKVWADKSLGVHVSGSGNVEYYGNPQVSKHVSGSGGVCKLADRP